MIKGKALLIIEKLDSKYVPFDVTAYVQSCSDPEYDPREDFSFLETDTFPLPKAAYKLDVGDRLWVSVVYRLEWRTDYWGETDGELYYLKERVLKRVLNKKRRGLK